METSLPGSSRITANRISTSRINPDSIDTKSNSGSCELSPGAQAKKRLTFSKDGICRICLEGLPKPFEIEALIEDYVANVEFFPYTLKVILLDISQLVHLAARSRQVFSELLVQASKHYGSEVQLVIAGGPPMIRKYTEIFCRALRFKKATLSFETLEQVISWLGSNR